MIISIMQEKTSTAFHEKKKSLKKQGPDGKIFNAAPDNAEVLNLWVVTPMGVEGHFIGVT